MTVAAARRPVIVGAHEGATRAEGRSCQQLMASSAVGALADAGCAPADVDAVFTAHTWEEPSLMESVLLAEALGIQPVLTETVALGGAGPAGMIARAAAAVQAGVCEVAVLATASNRRSGLGREAAIAALRDVAHPSAEVPFGAYIPALYAQAAQRHMHRFGTTGEQLAAVAVQQRANAAMRPLATLTKPISIDDVLGSPVIASPLHMLDCCLVTDFGTALVVTSAARARQMSGTPVPILGWGEAHGPLSLTRNPTPEQPQAARIAAAQALKHARVSASELDSAQLYDSFTITVLMLIEALGLCPPGTAGSFVQSGATGPRGPVPINTNGGMLSFATGGMFHATEAVATLRGQRTEVIGKEIDLSFVHGVGGVLSSHVSVVLGGQRTL